jgi:hypothetical protein
MNETVDVTSPVLVAVSKLPGAVFYRQNCGLFLTLDGKRHIRATSIEGLGDIVGTYRGYSIHIETKKRRGVQGESQRMYQKKHEQAGGVYIIAKSPEQALAALVAL